jgi:hypothetical protein
LKLESVACAQGWKLRLFDDRNRDTVFFRFSTKQEVMREVDAIYRRALDEGFLLAEADTVVTDSMVFLHMKSNPRFLLNEVHFFSNNVEGTSMRVKWSLSGNSLNRVFSHTDRL